MHNPHRYCLPIIKTEFSDVELMVKDQDKNYQFFEIWLDYLTDAKNDSIIKLAKQLKARAIFLFRRKNLEPITMPITRRHSLIEVLSGTDSFIDLDISQTEDLFKIRKLSSSPKLILSYHNYDSTPDTVHLERIIATMEEYKPAIYKLATRCESPYDALALLDWLLKLREAGKKAVVLGMGDQGLVTRVFGALWGNEINFAPHVIHESSAPGQLTQQQLEAIFKELGQ